MFGVDLRNGMVSDRRTHNSPKAGYSTAEIAERMRVTRETLRSYLKQVFMKTGARRQAELIGMVLNSPAIFAKGSDP